MNGRLLQATWLLALLGAVAPPWCPAQSTAKPAAAKPTTAQPTAGGQLDAALRPEMRAGLKDVVRGSLADRRLQLENQGKQAVQAVTVADITGGIPGIDRLNALDPDPTQQRDVEKALAARIRELTGVAPYSGLANVNTSIDEHAGTLVRTQLAGALGGQFQRALAATPAAIAQSTLRDLDATEGLVKKVAQAKWDEVSGRTATGSSSFSRLSDDMQSGLTNKARQQVAERVAVLLNQARSRLETLAKDPKHTWPEVSPDSRPARDRVVTDAAGKLLAAAGIPSNSGTQGLLRHAETLSGIWFDARLTAVIRSDQLTKLEKLKRDFADYEAAKKRGQSAEFPLPKVPKPPENATAEDLKKHLDTYVKIVMLQEWNMELQEAVTELRQGLASFVQPVVEERLAYYRGLSQRIAKARAQLPPEGSRVGPVYIRREENGDQADRQQELEGVDSADEDYAAYLEGQVAALEITKKVQKIQESYHVAEYGLTDSSLGRLIRDAKLSPEVAQRLQPLVGQVFEDQRSYDEAVKKALAGLNAGAVMQPILAEGRLRSNAPDIRAPADALARHDNPRAVEYHRDRILEQLAQANPAIAAGKPLYAHAKAEAEKAAQELVARQGEVIARLKARADEVARQLRAKSMPGVGSALSPFGSLRTADKRVFGTDTQRNEIACEIAAEVLNDQPPEVRYDPAVIRALQELIAEAAAPAEAEIRALIEKVFPVGRGERGNGMVREDALQESNPEKRRGSVQEDVIETLLKRSPDIAEKLTMDRVQRLVKRHVDELYGQIATIPAPDNLTELDTYLQHNIQLGVDGISSRDALARKGALVEQEKALTDEIKAKIRTYRSDLATYLPSDEFQEVIKTHAAALLAASPIPKPKPKPDPDTIPNPIQPQPPPTPPNPKPPVVNPPPPKPAPEPPAELDLLVTVKADPNSQSLEVAISCKAIDFSTVERISQTDDRTLAAGIEKIKTTLLEKSPDLIMKAFNHTQAKEARFAVRMDLRGKRVPQGMPMDCAVMINTLFAEWQKWSKLIRPTLFGQYTTDQRTAGKLEDLIPVPTVPST